LELVRSVIAHDERVKLLVNETPGLGVWYARNVGLETARGKFIAFLDSDDYMLQDSLSYRINTANCTGAKVVFGPYLRMYDGDYTRLVSVKDKVCFRDMARRNHIGNLTGMYDSDFLGKIMQENICHEDYLMWSQLVKRAGYAYSTGHEPLGVYRVSSMSLSGNKLRAFYWHWQVLTRGLQVNFLSALLFQINYVFYSIIERVGERLLGK